MPLARDETDNGSVSAWNGANEEVATANGNTDRHYRHLAQPLGACIVTRCTTRGKFGRVPCFTFESA